MERGCQLVEMACTGTEPGVLSPPMIVRESIPSLDFGFLVELNG